VKGVIAAVLVNLSILSEKAADQLGPQASIAKISSRRGIMETRATRNTIKGGYGHLPAQ
jgi:hypothetical protein